MLSRVASLAFCVAFVQTPASAGGPPRPAGHRWLAATFYRQCQAIGNVRLRQSPGGEIFSQVAPGVEMGLPPGSLIQAFNARAQSTLKMTDGERGLELVSGVAAMTREINLGFDAIGEPVLLHSGSIQGNMRNRVLGGHDFLLAQMATEAGVVLTAATRFELFLGDRLYQPDDSLRVEYAETAAQRSASILRRIPDGRLDMRIRLFDAEIDAQIFVAETF